MKQLAMNIGNQVISHMMIDIFLHIVTRKISIDPVLNLKIMPFFLSIERLS